MPTIDKKPSIPTNMNLAIGGLREAFLSLDNISNAYPKINPRLIAECREMMTFTALKMREVIDTMNVLDSQGKVKYAGCKECGGWADYHRETCPLFRKKAGE